MTAFTVAIMRESEYIINTLTEWSRKFPDIHLRYAYDEGTDYHIIEVYPEEIRRGNKEYVNCEIIFWEQFNKLYPNSDLLISEPNELNNMSNFLFIND